MSPFEPVRGFEDVWRPAAGPRVYGPASAPKGMEVRARLARLAARAPEVMVKITGRTRDAGHLRAHLLYISREAALTLEGRDGEQLERHDQIRERGEDWAADALRGRRDAALSLSLVLSMPEGTPAGRTRDAARAFAAEVFGARYDYVFALHTDAGHPHVHISVRMQGDDGSRLNPRKADLEAWRQSFARHLRARDIEAEATPRRARGVVRKAERIAIRKLRDRHERAPHAHPAPRVYAEARTEAEALATGRSLLRPWEAAILRRQRAARGAYAVGAEALARSDDPADQRLAARVKAFLETMPPISTRRNDLLRELRSVAGRRAPERPPPARDR